MNKYVVEGGKKLQGDVVISGSKNAALPILAATLLTDEEVILKNVPVLK
ncbi:MAG: UDP-N-acetylglucosamine 1-carboxyvinyltransferase, partial [Spirochaetia bacterium]|nr:UDP-N-acetylglucosamine 1-carboxyvinyltransferase [Spirochaetia bacterium]